MSVKKYITVVILLAAMLMSAGASTASAAADLTTKFRVYQQTNVLREFTTYAAALQYAQAYSNSHIERIGSRSWLWHNLPRFKLYGEAAKHVNKLFQTADDAVAVAKKWPNSAVRDLQSTGWLWNNYARYQLFQGDKTQSSWYYPTLAAAKKAAAQYSNAHIIDLAVNRWIWDNSSAAAEEAFRHYSLSYQVSQNGKTKPEWSFSYLKDAVKEAAKWSDAQVSRLSDNKVIYATTPAYSVTQNERVVKLFHDIQAAAAYAKSLGHARIVLDGVEVWSNYAYLQVQQNDKQIGEYHTIQSAILFAQKYANASIRTTDGIALWDNFRKLLFLGWNGSSNSPTIRSHVANTQGLDIDSPTWFVLKDDSGAIQDDSDPAVAAELKQAGINVYPLVHNNFDGALTHRFFSNPTAQQSFINKLVQRVAAIGAAGINLDFEGLQKNDRDAFTAFVSKLSIAAKASKLKLTIDLPRGDMAWNHNTAYDSAKLAPLVDGIIIMAYDQHWQGSDTAGTVAGLQWVEQGIKDFLAYGVPRDKLFLGVPFYVRQWELAEDGSLLGTKALLMSTLPQLMSEMAAVKTWDASTGQFKVDYYTDGKHYVFWLESNDTAVERIKLAKKYELAGVAAWRLGYEPAELWPLLIRHK